MEREFGDRVERMKDFLSKRIESTKDYTKYFSKESLTKPQQEYQELYDTDLARVFSGNFETLEESEVLSTVRHNFQNPFKYNYCALYLIIYQV